MRKEPVDAGNSHIIQSLDFISQCLCCQGGFFGYRHVAGASSGDDDCTRGGEPILSVDNPNVGERVISKGKIFGQVGSVLIGEPGNQNVRRMVGQHGTDDSFYLPSSL